MATKSKILLYLLFLAIALSVAFTYFRVFILKDYIISGLEASCDPARDNCFIRQCDPEIDGACSENPEENLIYYKMVDKNLKNILPCAEDDENCPDYSCKPNEADCEEIFCDETNVIEGETCNDPATYLNSNL